MREERNFVYYILFVLAFAGVLIAISACADDLAPGADAATDESGDSDAAGPEPTVHTESSGNVAKTRVKSSDYERWVYVSLDEGGVEVHPTLPEEDTSWDLGFRRFEVKLNGGSSGGGDGELALVERTSLEGVEPPAEGYVTDEPDLADDDDEEDELAFMTVGDGWFDYDAETHVLTPKPRVYVVRGAGGSLFALTILSYYDAAGNAARFEYDWMSL